MKLLDEISFLSHAGIPLLQSRDMSAYEGKPFECACGRSHDFQTYYSYRNYGTTGANAKMVVICPADSNFATLIKTKYKYFVVFDRFESLAGCCS